MWKGEPGWFLPSFNPPRPIDRVAAEFHLVAGGDELYPENDSPVSAPVKLEDHYDANSLIAFDQWEDSDHPHSNSVSPNFSPADSQSEFPPTPEHRPNLYPSDFGSVNPKLQHHDLAYLAPTINSPSVSPHGDYIQQLPPFHDAAIPYTQTGKYPAVPYTVAPNRATRGAAQDPQQSHALVNRHMSATPTHYKYAHNKVTSMHLHADGMTPFSVKVDALTSPAQPVQPPFTLRIRLYIPMTNDMRAPHSLIGFLAGVSLDNVWSVTARCVTKVYGNNVCIAEETNFLQVTNISVGGTVNAALPESPLSRCRWLDPGTLACPCLKKIHHV